MFYDCLAGDGTHGTSHVWNKPLFQPDSGRFRCGRPHRPEFIRRKILGDGMAALCHAILLVPYVHIRGTDISGLVLSVPAVLCGGHQYTDHFFRGDDTGSFETYRIHMEPGRVKDNGKKGDIHGKG